MYDMKCCDFSFLGCAWFKRTKLRREKNMISINKFGLILILNLFIKIRIFLSSLFIFLKPSTPLDFTNTELIPNKSTSMPLVN
jgi:hypothetical protein